MYRHSVLVSVYVFVCVYTFCACFDAIRCELHWLLSVSDAAAVVVYASFYHFERLYFVYIISWYYLIQLLCLCSCTNFPFPLKLLHDLIHKDIAFRIE